MIELLKTHLPQCFDKDGKLIAARLKESINELIKELELNAQTTDATQIHADNAAKNTSGSQIHAQNTAQNSAQETAAQIHAEIQSQNAQIHAEQNSTAQSTAQKAAANAAKSALSKESYALTWLGSSYAKLMQRLPANTLITQDFAHNAQPQNAHSKNVLIKGDNLEVLKHLKNAYYRKVKAIYIDPPYNTGSGDFIYKDERDFTPQSLAELAGIEEREAKRILEKTLNKSSTHSAWLSFMHPRLHLAKALLRDDGVIFISIDDNEQANLKLLCDSVFGEGNFVANFIWQRTKTPARLSKNVSKTHEFILIYAKNVSEFSMNKMPLNDEYVKKTYKNPDNDPRGKWRTAPLLGTESSGNKMATYTLPDGREITGKWRCSEETLQRYIRENRLVYCENGAPNKKIFLSENEGQTINTILLDSGTNDNATDELKAIFERAIFDFAKPTKLIKTLLQLSTNSGGNEREREREREREKFSRVA